MTREPNFCKFCGATGNITAEHVWPQWLRNVIGVPEGQTHRVSIVDTLRIEDDTAILGAQNFNQRQGTALGWKVRQVCRQCNNGWMSLLEQQVKPLLEPLLTGQIITLDQSDMAVIARWAIKTAWMREYIDVGEKTTTTEMRKFLMENELPPPRSRAWIAKHEGYKHLDLQQGLMVLTQSAQPSSDDTRKAQLSVLTLGGLALAVWTVNGDGVANKELSPPWMPLWPAVHNVQWPLAAAVSDDDIDAAIRQQSDIGKLAPHSQVKLPNID